MGLPCFVGIYDSPYFKKGTREMTKPRLDQGADYERGFVDGMSKQAQSSVDKAVNAMSQRTWAGLTDEEIKAFDTWHDNREEEVGWCNPSEIVAYIEAKLKDKNT
jgi:hypothetical protein